MQESKSDRYFVSKVLMLAVAFAVAVPAGGFFFADAAEPVQTNVVMVQADTPEAVAMVAQSGAEIVYEYGNGWVLTRVTNAQANGLESNGIYTETYTDRTVVDLASANIKFDTANGEPAMPANLVRAPYAFNEKGRYLVQFAGPADSSWQGMVEDTGASVVQWLGGNLCLVAMDGAQKAQVENLGIVEWVGIYHPAYKVPKDMATTGSAMYAGLAYDEVDCYELAAQMEAAGATINRVENSVHMIYFMCDISIVPTIANLEGLHSFSMSGISKTTDLIAGEVHYFHHAWYTSWSGLSTTLTGTGQRLHIQDTGFDEGNAGNGHPDWFDGNNGDRIIWFFDQTGRSVPDGLEGGVAHGTHCTGISTGDGWCWETSLSLPTNDDVWHEGEAGVAPEAMVGMDGCAQGAGLATQLTYITDAFNTYQTYVSSNSWGSAISDYTTNSNTIDDMIDSADGDGNNGRMVVFAAGNDGPDDYTIGDYAMMKNGLGIGACENYRPDRFSSDNPNVVADFSSRSGPTWSYGRIKPDLLATGTSVVSAFSRGEWDYNVANAVGNPSPDMIMDVDEYNYMTLNPGQDARPDYAYMQGTSMATPMSAGLYMLTREYFQEVKGIALPSSQLCKATLVNGADPMNTDLYPFPGYDQGWGRINLKNSLFPDAPRTNQYETATMAAVGTWTPTTMNRYVVSSDVPMVVTLCWVDSPGIALARNLDLRLTSPSGTAYWGNNYANGWTVAGSTVSNTADVIEQVSIMYPETGTWTIQVVGVAVPTAAPFALVFSADVGGVENYQPDLSIDGETTFSTVTNGKAAQVVTLLNFGTTTDTISVSENGPFAATFTPAGPYLLASNAKKDITVTYTATALAIGIYDFQITATSAGDSSQDSLNIRGQVLANALPKTLLIADASSDEKDPSVVTFYDGANYRIFVTYLLATSDGNRVMVKHTTLSATTKEPVLPWNGPYEIGAAATGDYFWPNDPRITYMPSGTFANRVMISFSADDLPTYTADPTGETSSSSFGAYADLAGTYSTWTNVRIDLNTFSTGASGYKRVQVTVARPQGNQFVHIWEHLDYNGETMTGVDSHMRVSATGGASWGAAVPVTPGDGNLYFFPNACLDQNGLVWIVFYWRTPAGNDRDLCVRLTDGTTLGTQYNTWDTSDNVQFPACTSTAEGTAGNRVYITVARDAGTPSFRIWTTYYDGDATLATNLGTDGVNSGDDDVWTHAEGPFGTILSDANYNRRPILVITGTGDGFTWVPYMEASNPYGDINMYSIYSDDAFASITTTIVTADSYAKGHQMASSLTIGTSYNMYEVFHASHGSVTEVNYDIYLIIYHENWENDPDLTGPITKDVMANPNPLAFPVPSTVTLTANIFDEQLTALRAAQYKETTTAVSTLTDWTGAVAMTLSGVTASETATQIISTTGWKDGSVHRFFVRGQDNSVAQNWGAGVYVDVQVGEPQKWYLQIQDDGIANYQNLSTESLSGGATQTVSITGAGEFKVGTINWMTDNLLLAYDVAGTWNFNIYGYNTLTTASGFLYAKVYRYNSGTPVLLFTTGYDDENIQILSSEHLFSWGYTAGSTTVPVGDRIFAEIWVHATAGAADTRATTTYNYVGVTQATNNHYAWERNNLANGAAPPAPPSDAGTWTEALNADYTSLSISNTARFDSAEGTGQNYPGQLFEFDMTQTPSQVTGLEYTYEGLSLTAGTTFTFWMWNPTANTATSVYSGAFGTADSTSVFSIPTGSIQSYISTTGMTAMGVTTSVQNNMQADYVQLKVQTGTVGPFFNLNYDSTTSPSNVVPPSKATFDTVIITNIPPNANAGIDQTGTANYLCTFNGGGSTDTDGTISSYTWTFTYNSLPQTLTGMGPTFNFQIPGTYPVMLTVVDDDGASDTDFMTVTVNVNPPNANAGVDLTGTANYLATFNGAGSTDADGTIVIYSWAFTDVTPQVITGVSPTYTFMNSGVYAVTLTVTDDDGATDTDTMTVTVNLLTHNIALAAGWNLISFAVNTEGGKPLATVFADEWTNILAIQYYDPLTGDWKIYDKGQPAYMNDLKTADETKGYWVKVTSASTLTVTGKALTTTTINLRAGWNMVGVPDNANVAAQTVLAGTSFDGLQKYTVSTYLIGDMLGTELMVPGSAYWVHVPTTTSYVVTY